MTLDNIPNGNITAMAVSTRLVRELDEAANDLAPLLVECYLARADSCKTLTMGISLSEVTSYSAQGSRHYMAKEVQLQVKKTLHGKNWQVEFRNDGYVDLTPEFPLVGR